MAHAFEHEDLSSADALTRFYRKHSSTVYGYVLRLAGGDRAVAEDLTQETWLALTAELKAGNAHAGSLRWLLGVARHRFIDQLRRSERGERKLRLIAAETRDADSDSTVPAGEVLALVATLDPLHRLVLMMRYVDELPVPAIADAVGRTIPATYSLLARARDELRSRREATS